ARRFGSAPFGVVGLPLAQNWIGKSFVHAICGPYLQRCGNKLRVLVCIDIEHLAPTHANNVNAMVVIGRAIGKILYCGPPHDYGRIPGGAFHPYIMNCELQRGSHPAQPFEPPSQCFTIVPLAAARVMPAKPVMNISGTALQDWSIVLLIHSQEVP